MRASVSCCSARWRICTETPSYTRCETEITLTWNVERGEIRGDILDTWTLIFHFPSYSGFYFLWGDAAASTWHVQPAHMHRWRWKGEITYRRDKEILTTRKPVWCATRERQEEELKGRGGEKEPVAALWATQRERGGSVAICLFFFSRHLLLPLSHLLNWSLRLKAAAPKRRQLWVCATALHIYLRRVEGWPRASAVLSRLDHPGV